MTNVTTLSQVAPGVQAFYDRNLLTRAQPNDVHGRFGQKRPIPKNSGNQIKFRRYSQLAAATNALTEGVTPSGSALSVTDVTSTLVQYGDFVTLTDMVSMTNQDPVVTEATDCPCDRRKRRGAPWSSTHDRFRVKSLVRAMSHLLRTVLVKVS